MLSPSFPDQPHYKGPPVRTSPFLGHHGLAEKWLSLGPQPQRALGLLISDFLLTPSVHRNPWGAMMLMDLMDDCKISHLEFHCSRRIPCEVDLPKAVESGFFFPSVTPEMGLSDHLVTMRALEHPWGPT